MSQVQMNEQDYHTYILELREKLLKMKKVHCERKRECKEYVNKIYYTGTESVKLNEKKELIELKSKCMESKQIMRLCIDEFIAKMILVNQTNHASERKRLEKYMEMWEKVPECFAELLLRITEYNTLQHVSVNDVIDASLFNKELDAIKLIEEEGRIGIHC